MSEVYGLPLHPRAAGYLHEAFGLEAAGEVAGVPAFTEGGGRAYLGGYDNLYSVLIGDADVKACTAWRRGKRYARYAFSTERDLFGAKREHYLLAVPPGTAVEERFALYKGKTRNQVRKSLPLITDVLDEPHNEHFYALYVETVVRLGGSPRSHPWFERFEKHFGSDVHTIAAYHEGKLVGANYYVRAGDYSLLLFNVSDPHFWHLDVNNRLYDAYIESALGGGVRFIDFGPGLATDRSHAHFKEGFGGVGHFMADQLHAPFSTRVKEALVNRIKRYARPARRA